MQTLSPYAQNRKARKEAAKARHKALDKALRAYFAARNEAMANGTKPPHIDQYVTAEMR